MNTGNSQHTKNIYYDLTGVKIDEQYKEWDARGKGYYGEYLLFSEIYNKVPGTCKILMNLQIPSENGKTTEIDLLVIHETGLYVFEAKHYKGTIYGKIDEKKWTQYFRTAPNQSFNSPIRQNKWHIEQLSKLYPNLPIRSFIVFTNEECTLNVTGSMDNTTLCYLHNMSNCLAASCSKASVCMSMEHIDEVFNALKVYSPIRQANVTKDGVVLSFYDFFEEVAKAQTSRMQELEKNYEKKEKEAENSRQTTKRRAIFAVVAILLICFVKVSGYKQEKNEAVAQANAKQAQVDAQIEKYQAAADAKAEQYKNQADADLAKHKAQADAEVEQYRKQADAEVEQYRAEAEAARAEQQKFAEKWQVVTDFVVDGNLLSEDFVTVSNVVLKDSVDFGNLVKLSCTLTHNGEDFYALIDKSSMFTVVLKDGRVVEFPCYSSQYSSYSLGYSSSVKKIGGQKLRA